MADILLRKTGSFWEAMTPARIAEVRLNPVDNKRYLDKYMPGDPVEVRETGYWSDPDTGRNFPAGHCVLCIEDVTMAQVVPYATPLIEGEVTLNKKRYRFDLSVLSFIDDIAIISKWKNIIVIDKAVL